MRPIVPLTSYARLSASLATVSPASSPRPSSLSMASSVPMINDFPEVGGKVIASTDEEKQIIIWQILMIKGCDSSSQCLYWYFDLSTFVCSVPLVLIEAGGVGPALWGGRRLHVRQVFCISQVGEHVLQFGPVWPCVTGKVKQQG